MPTAADATLLARLVSLASGELGSALDVRVGWPRRAVDDDLARASRGPGVFLHLEASAEPSRQSHVWLDAALAIEIADRALGGSGVAAPAAHPAAQLGEAELGVIAYVVARALRAADMGLRLHDLGTQAPRLPEGSLMWPLEAHLGQATGAVRLWLPAPSPRALQPTHGQVRLRWVIAAEPMQPEPLSPGDVALLDHTTRAGEGWLRVLELDGLLAVRQRDGALTVGSQSPPDRAFASLEIDLGSWPIARLSELGAGASVPLTPRDEEIVLRRDGRDLLRGELVRLGGKLGVRATGTL